MLDTESRLLRHIVNIKMKMKNRSIKEIEHLLPKIKKHLQQTYKRKLESVILYGSFAKNKATKDSDIDIAIVLKGKVNPSKEIDKVNDFINNLEFEYDELITILPVSSSEIKNSIWPLYKSLKREGIQF